MQIRAHHLLCMQLFKGKGYSEEFCKGMESVIHKVRDLDTQIEIISNTDGICESCPNRIKQTECLFGTEDVRTKDNLVIETLTLDKQNYSYTELREQLKEKIDENAFNKICGTCRWYKMGICSYKAFKHSFTKDSKYFTR